VRTGFGALLVGMYAIAWAQRTLALARNGWVDENAMPFGGDFVTFWAASRLALEGRALEAFDSDVFFAVQDAPLPGNAAHFLWNYPPTFHLFVLPLGLVDVVTATWLWWLIGIPLYLAALWRVCPRTETLVLGLASSATLLNLAHGQNGFLLTAIFVGGMALVLRDRPVLGGLLLGCLAIKPHFGVLLPIALAFGRRPRAFAATAVSLGAWCAVSTAVFGLEYWSVFLSNLSIVGQAIDTGDLAAEKLVTPYVFARTAGLTGVAGAIQVASTLLAGAAVAWAFTRDRPWGATATLLVATTLCSPYLFDYDLVLIVGAAAFAAVDRRENGALTGEWAIWLVAGLLPIAFAPLATATGLQFGPVVTGVLLATCVAAVGRSSAASEPL
jgi:hypothetical protein